MTKTNKEPIQSPSSEDWMTKKWRPMVAWMYIICCVCDFALFPIMFTVVQFWESQAANDAFRQWVPITLQGGGLFHISVCAVLGVSAYGRTQEKLNGAANAATTLPAGLPTAAINPVPIVTNSAGAQPLGNTTSVTGFGAVGAVVPAQESSWLAPAAVTTGWGGKAAPPAVTSWPER